jgi:UPF0755 protein
MRLDFGKIFKGVNGIVIITLVVILILMSSLVFSFIRNLSTPFSKEKTDVQFEISKGEGVRKIAADLKDKKLLKNKLYFLIYLKFSGLSDDLKAGYYKLNTNYSPKEIADILSKGKVASRKITIPEGWTIKEIGEYLEKQDIVKKDDFIAATKGKYTYDSLTGLPNGASVEGFLFPDTYQIPFNVNAEYIVNKMLENFDNKITKELRAQISATNLNLYQTITLASIVEKEVSKPADRKLVAGIFKTRLSEGMMLQSDVTVNYALNNNKKILSADDIEIDSPYNTYKVSALPYGPISNPGLESIKAVINPEKSDFIYFLAADGVTYYSKTLEEHEEKKAKYLN